MSTYTDRQGAAKVVMPVRRADRWDRVIKVAHWSTLLLITAAYAAVWASQAVPSREQHTMLLQLHRSLGITVFALTLFRLGWRWCARIPSLPADLPPSQKIAARATEYLLYTLLLAQPVLGMVHSNARAERISFYFLADFPPLVARDKILAKEALAAHGVVAEMLLAVIALHAAAALFHRYVRRDDVLKAMLPRRCR